MHSFSLNALKIPSVYTALFRLSRWCLPGLRRKYMKTKLLFAAGMRRCSSRSPPVSLARSAQSITRAVQQALQCHIPM